MNNLSMNPGNSSFQHVTLEELNHAEFLRLLPTSIFLIIIALIGIPGNGLVIYIYRSQYMDSSPKLFMFFIAIVDLMCCCIVIPGDIVINTEEFIFTESIWCKSSVFGTLWANMSLINTVVIVTIDRFRKICKPLGWQITVQRGRYLCVVAVVLGLCSSVPTLVVYDIHVHTFELPGYDLVGTKCTFQFRNNEDQLDYFALFYVFLGTAVITVLLITICVLYCFIGKETKQRIQRKKTKRENDRRNRNGTPMIANKSKTVDFKIDNLEPIATIKLTEVGQEDFSTKPKPQTATEATSYWYDDSSQGMPSGDDTCEMDYIPKQKLTKAQKTKSTRVRRAQVQKATYSMFLISLVFVLSYLPFMCLTLVRGVISGYYESLSETRRAVFRFFTRTFHISYAINPIIYHISDSKFRHNCKVVLVTVRGKLAAVCK